MQIRIQENSIEKTIHAVYREPPTPVFLQNTSDHLVKPVLVISQICVLCLHIDSVNTIRGNNLQYMFRRWRLATMYTDSSIVHLILNALGG